MALQPLSILARGVLARLGRPIALAAKYPAYAAEALTLWCFWQICSRLSPERAAGFGRRVVSRIGTKLSQNGRINRNIRMAFPETPRDIRRIIARGIWGAFGQVLAEYPHLERICWAEAGERLKIVIKDENAAWRRGEKPAVFVSAHLGNWELAAAAAVTEGVPLSVVYSPQANPLVDRMIQKQRRALRCGMVSKHAGLRGLVRELERGRSIGLVVDQRVDSGEELPFFGRPSMTTLAPARLALKFGVELVPLRVERLGSARYQVTVFEPLMPRDPKGDKDQQAVDLMSQVNALFEEWIKERPVQWHCVKRRWRRDEARVLPSQPVDQFELSRPGEGGPSASTASEKPEATQTPVS
jgi:KDO2-lipid IV(A) lauroyltransferase